MNRKRNKRSGKHQSPFLRIVHPDCAGIDIGGSFHLAAVSPDRDEQPVRRFEAFTDDLERLADWLRACKVTVVAMESTGVYWIPLYEILDRRGFEVHLTDGVALAKLRDPRVKADEKTIARALTGHWRDTALTVAAEVGTDLSRFADSQHFCSWTTLAPGTRISGGKPLPGRTPRIINRVGQALRLAATHARSSDSYIGAAYRARLARMEKAKAIKATAHQLARLIYAILTHGQAYVEHGVATFEDERRERQIRNLRRNAEKLGLALMEAA